MKRRKLKLKPLLLEWVRLCGSSDHINYECASIHYNSHITSNAFYVLSMKAQRLQMVRLRRKALFCFKVFKHWKRYALHVSRVRRFYEDRHFRLM